MRFASLSYDETKHSSAIGLEGPVGDAVMGKANYSQDEYNQRKRQIEQTFSNEIRYFNEIDYAKASGDHEIISAWSQCMNQNPRFSIDFVRNDNTNATITFQWHDAETNIFSTHLTQNIVLGNRAVLQGQECLNTGREYKNGEPCPVTIALTGAKDSLSIVASTVNGMAQSYIPPRMKLEPHHKSLETFSGECLAIPNVGNIADSAWRDWGTRCQARQINGIKNGSMNVPPFTYKISDELIEQGYSIDPNNTDVAISAVWGTNNGNKCVGNQPIISTDSITYNYSMDATHNPNVTLVCLASPRIGLIRDELVPIN